MIPINNPIMIATEASLNKLICLCSKYVYNNAITPKIVVIAINMTPVIEILLSSEADALMKGYYSIIIILKKNIELILNTLLDYVINIIYKFYI